MRSTTGAAILKSMPAIFQTASQNSKLSAHEVSAIVEQACPAKEYRQKKILLIIPDGTRTAPVGLLFKTVFEQIGEATAALDVLIALGTHQPMSNAAICERLDITESEWRDKYPKVRF